MPLLSRLSKEQVDPYVTDCINNIDSLSINDADDLVGYMLRITEVYELVCMKDARFVNLFLAAIDLAKGCNVSTNRLVKVIDEYNNYFDRR